MLSESRPPPSPLPVPFSSLQPSTAAVASPAPPRAVPAMSLRRGNRRPHSLIQLSLISATGMPPFGRYDSALMRRIYTRAGADVNDWADVILSEAGIWGCVGQA